MDLPIFASIILILILFYAGAWISSAETALFSLSSHKIKTYETDPDPKKQLIAHLLAHPRDLLVTVFMINTCVNIFLQNVFSDMFGPTGGWALKVGLPLILTLVFGEIIPKYIGLQNNTAIAYRISPTLDWLNSSLKWIRKIVIRITTPISRIMFFFLKKEESISMEEMEHVLRTSMQQGLLNHGEAELLEGYLHLQDKPIKELMWPKEDVLYYDIEDPISKLIYLFTDLECTRVPVCKGSLEKIIGVITVMQFFQNQDKINKPGDLIPFLQKPFYVPVTTPSKLLLKRMDEANHILALIVDEYGSITGIVSREDLIEVVVGRIEDEKEKNNLFIKAGGQEAIASGKWELSEFNQYFKSELKSQNYVTIGGWLIEELGDIPKSGSKFEIKGFEFQVLSASPTRILRLFIKKTFKTRG